MSGPALLLVILAGIGTGYLLLAGFFVRRLSRAPPGEEAASPGVAILKPLHGEEPELAENLRSFLLQNYPGPVQVVFGVQHPADPAIAVVRGLQEAYPDRDIALVIDGRVHGTNRKVSNLINMAGRVRHDVIVLADSDMRAPPGYLRRVVALLGAPGTGAVTCPYHGLAIDTLWSRLTALGIDRHFLPGIAMSVGLGVGHPCMGSTIALRRETLARIGGFECVADELADDHVIGARVRGLGLGLSVAPFTVGHLCPERRLRDLLLQELRWMRTVRQVEPAGHLGSLVTHPFPFALAAFLIEPGLATGAALGLAAGAGFALCLAVERAFGLKRHPYWLLPMRDLLSFALFVASFFGRAVNWRGRDYGVARSGALLPKMTREPT